MRDAVFHLSYVTNLVNAQIHPTVAGFFNLNRERIIQRYCHLHPAVAEKDLHEYLNYRPAHFHWAGSDLFVVTNAHGLRQAIIIETNSCPSGQKSMPLLQDIDDYGGYRKVYPFFLSSDVGYESVRDDAKESPKRMGRSRCYLG